MDHIGILKHAFHTTIRNRALWVLGFLWALVGGSGGSSGLQNLGNWGDNVQYQFDRGNFPNVNFDPRTLIVWIVLACGILLILGIAATVVRYVLQAGVYRTLDKMEHEGVQPNVRMGFRQGWHRRTWRLFLQNLIVGIPLVIGLLLLLALAASPLLLLTANSDAAGVIGVVSAVGLFIAWLLFALLLITVVSVLQQFWWRAAVIGDQDTMSAIRNGWHLVRAHLGDVAIMWLLMVGIGILFVILMIPFMILVVMLVALVAGGPGYLLYQATESLAPALIWGIPVGLVLLVVPITFVSGLYLVFQTSVWNQVYSQLVQRTAQVATPAH